MLVIATLLVPLGILAGLATAGTGATAVRLDDPVTVGAILLVGAMYCTLLWWGGKALVRRDAAPLCLSVAGPAIMLPFVPAAIRQFSGSVHWTVAGGSVALMVALVWLVRGAHRAKSKTLGVATGQHRLLIIFLGCFSLAALVGNVLYLLRETPGQWIAIALSLIPALCAIAATAHTLSGWEKRPKLALAGMTVCVIALGAVAAMLPAALVAPQWLWYWALTVAASLTVVAFLMRLQRFASLAIVPVGLAVVLTSSTWTAFHAWEEMWLWQRLLGGQPMLASFGVGVLAALVAATGVSRSRNLASQSYTWAIAGIFMAWGAVNAVVLSIGPPSMLGALVPAWVVTVLLGVSAVGCALAPVVIRRRGGETNPRVGESLSLVAVPLVVLTWASVLHPLVIGAPLAPLKTWLLSSLAIATTMLATTEALGRFYSKTALRVWHGGAALTCALSVLFALPLVGTQWSTACVGLLVVTVLMFWGASMCRQTAWLWAAQLASLAASLVLGWGHYRHFFVFADRLGNGDPALVLGGLFIFDRQRVVCGSGMHPICRSCRQT